MWNGYDDQSSDRVQMIVGALIGALAVGVIWLGQTVFTRDSESTPSEVRQPSSETEPSAVVDAGTGHSGEHGDGSTTAVERCREVYAAQDEPLRAAAAALEQWEVHIGAMNKLIVGAITLKQATQFWNRTRVGASGRLEDVAAAGRRFDQRTARCPQPGRTAATELDGCYRAVLARNRALRLASVTLRTWAEHVHHMNMLRSGDMTPEQATELWLQSWRQGDRELRDYRAAAGNAQGLSC